MSTELIRYVETIERHTALAYAPPPFELVEGEARRTEGYVVVMRTKASPEFKLAVLMAGESWQGSGDSAKKLTGAVPIAYDANEFVAPESDFLDVTNKRRVLSRDTAEALFADACADLRRGGKVMRQWCEVLPFQVVLAKTTLKQVRRRVPDWLPVVYASGPRWIQTKERPRNEPPF